MRKLNLESDLRNLKDRKRPYANMEIGNMQMRMCSIVQNTLDPDGLVTNSSRKTRLTTLSATQNKWGLNVRIVSGEVRLPFAVTTYDNGLRLIDSQAALTYTGMHMSSSDIPSSPQSLRSCLVRLNLRSQKNRLMLLSVEYAHNVARSGAAALKSVMVTLNSMVATKLSIHDTATDG